MSTASLRSEPSSLALMAWVSASTAKSETLKPSRAVSNRIWFANSLGTTMNLVSSSSSSTIGSPRQLELRHTFPQLPVLPLVAQNQQNLLHHQAEQLRVAGGQLLTYEAEAEAPAVLL